MEIVNNMQEIKPLNKCKVLVTPTSFAKYDKSAAKNLEAVVLDVFYNNKSRPLNENELLGLVNDIDGFIAGLDDITSRVIKSAKNLKVIARYGTGVDKVDLNAAKEAGIYVTNTPYGCCNR